MTVSARVRVTVHCDVSGCRAKIAAHGRLTHDGRILVTLPGAWRHAPVVTFCPRHLRLRRAAYKRRGEQDPLTWLR
jgi:hypothetical protein